MWIFVNDKFVEREQARISVFDHGFLYGDGVYETLRAYKGRILLAARHLVRLHQSCRLIGLDWPMPEERWLALLSEALRRNNLTDAMIRITVSRGEGELGLDPSLCLKPTIVILAKPATVYPQGLWQTGVRLALVQVRRNLATAQPPQIKSLSFLNNILAKQEALRASAFDGLMLNVEGFLTECTISNLFFVKSECIYTPSEDCGILSGITREVVIALCREHGLSLEEGRYSPDALMQADECFITNTSLEILPVCEVGNHPIGNTCPGPMTTRLHHLFHTNLERLLT